MPLTDVNQVTTSLNTLQLRDAATSSSISSHHVIAVGRQVKQFTMNSPTCVLGKQGNQNAAALSPEEGIGKTRDFINCPIVQENGQRRYGPPRGWKSDPPPRGCEVFIGKIPRDCLEDELIPVFEQIGPIYMFRLMMEFNGSNRGYGFCVYTNREDTKRAVQELDNYEIRKGKTIGVCFSVDNCRLFVGGIPKSKTREEIMTEMKRVTEGVKDVISYPSVNDKSKNRGFAFVEYESHKAAAMARRKLIPGRIQLWNQQIAVDWAEPEREVNEDIMSKVKILYVRNLMLSTTEESLREHFVKAAGGDPNCIERVKKITDYAFIHFKEREQAEICLNILNDTTIDGSKIEVSWAKPVDKSEANIRQQSNHTTNKLFGELDLGKELRSNNPLLIDPRTSSSLSSTTGLLSHLDPSIPFMLSHMGQHAAISPDILPMNPTLPSSSGATMNIGSPGGSRLNGARNGRRNAAGSRSAGIQRDRKHPVELLEELSRNVGWGTPNFTVLPTDFVDTLTGNKFQLYIGQVYLPNLRLQYQSPRYYATPEEAKIGACEMAILHLQYHQVMSADDAKNLVKQPILSTTFSTYGAFLSGPPVQLPILPFSNTALLDTQPLCTSGNCKSAHPITKTRTTSVSESSISASCSQETGLSQTTYNTPNEPCSSPNSGSHLPQPSVAASALLTTSTCIVPSTEASSRMDADEPSEVDPNEPHAANVNQPKLSGLICTQAETVMTASNAGPPPQLTCPAAASTSFGLPQVFTNNAHSFNYPPSTTFKPISHSQLATLQPSSYPACPVFAANYALALGANMLPSGAAYLPLQLSTSGPNSNNALQLLQAQSSCLPMSANGNQTSAHPAMGLSHSPDSTAALAAMNGFDYSPAFLPGQMTAATLIAPLGNASAYLFDPNCVSTAQAASMMVASGSSMSGLAASTATCPGELMHSHTLGQTTAFPTTSMPQTGLYTLGLQQSTLQNPSSQLTFSPNSHNSLLGMISQQQSFQPGISSQVIATTNVSLQTAQTLTNQKVQSFLPVPAPV